MCGNVGIAGDIGTPELALIKRLLVFDYWRGPDSTGLAKISSDGKSAEIAKVADNPFNFFEMTRFGKIANIMNVGAFIGHNRAATQGEVNTANAHPFQHDHIVGCHNGTLTHRSFCALEKALGQEFEVDSEAIIYSLATIGLQETLKYLEGAWALVWQDLRKGTLHFLKNDQRPLFYCRSNDRKTFFWASEFEILDASFRSLQDKHKWELEKSSKGGYVYFPFNNDTLYTVEIASGKDAKLVAKTGVKSTFEPPVLAVQTSFQGWPSTQTATTSSTKQSLEVPAKEAESRPFGSWLSVDRFKIFAQGGCAWCSASVDTFDTGITVIEQCQAVICKECSPAKDNTVRLVLENAVTTTAKEQENVH